MKAGMQKMCAKYGHLPAPDKICGKNIRISSHCSEIVVFFLASMPRVVGCLAPFMPCSNSRPSVASPSPVGGLIAKAHPHFILPHRLITLVTLSRYERRPAQLLKNPFAPCPRPFPPPFYPQGGTSKRAGDKQW